MNGQKNDIGTQSRTHRPLRAGSAGFESESALPTDGAIGRLFDGDYAVRFCSLRANKIYHMVPVVPTRGCSLQLGCEPSVGQRRRQQENK